ncbi:MAG: CxxC-x17-CxxC domain-containing protein [Candidatus Pacearchaeota archaeon]
MPFAFRRGFRNFRRMHKITCSECGKEAEVPFKPREGTPVYCRECFMKKKGITRKKPEEEMEKAEEIEENEE